MRKREIGGLPGKTAPAWPGFLPRFASGHGGKDVGSLRRRRAGDKDSLMRSDAAIPATMCAAGDAAVAIGSRDHVCGRRVVVGAYRDLPNEVPRNPKTHRVYRCGEVLERSRLKKLGITRSSHESSWCPTIFRSAARVGPRGTPGGGIELLASSRSGSPHYVSSSWRAPGMARSVLSRETARPSSESFAGRAGRPMINKPAAARVEQYPTSIATCPPLSLSPAHWPGESLDLDRICDNTFRRSLFMNQRSIHRGGRFSSTLGAYLLALTTVAALHAQQRRGI